MKKIHFVISTLLFLSTMIRAQEDKFNHCLGFNAIQLTSYTFELVYDIELNHKFDLFISSGYTVNYDNSWAKSHRFNCDIYDGYSFNNQSGAFLKIGGKYNFRKDYERKIFPYIGINFINSLVTEKGHLDTDTTYLSVAHNKYVAGIGIHTGLTFKIWKLYIDAGFQLSGAIINNDSLFGSFNYVPGMGSINGCRHFLRKNVIITIRYKI